jgi:hypothetical protein
MTQVYVASKYILDEIDGCFSQGKASASSAKSIGSVISQFNLIRPGRSSAGADGFEVFANVKTSTGRNGEPVPVWVGTPKERRDTLIKHSQTVKLRTKSLCDTVKSFSGWAEMFAVSEAFAQKSKAKSKSAANRFQLNPSGPTQLLSITETNVICTTYISTSAKSLGKPAKNCMSIAEKIGPKISEWMLASEVFAPVHDNLRLLFNNSRGASPFVMMIREGFFDNVPSDWMTYMVAYALIMKLQSTNLDGADLTLRDGSVSVNAPALDHFMEAFGDDLISCSNGAPGKMTLRNYIDNRHSKMQKAGTKTTAKVVKPVAVVGALSKLRVPTVVPTTSRAGSRVGSRSNSPVKAPVNTPVRVASGSNTPAREAPVRDTRKPKQFVENDSDKAEVLETLARESKSRSNSPTVVGRRQDRQDRQDAPPATFTPATFIHQN